MDIINPKENKVRNQSLDLLKFISAFMIVCIHIKFYGEMGKLITILARFAVPVFFMVSGYFSSDNSIEKLRNKVIHIIKIYIGAFILHFCFRIIIILFSGEPHQVVSYIVSYSNIKHIITFFLFNLSMTSSHLWFLGGLVYCYLIECLVIKLKIKQNIILIISCILLIINLVLGVGLSPFGMRIPLYLIRNFLFTGYPLFAFGNYIMKNEETILKIVTAKHILIMIIVCLVESIVMLKYSWDKDLYIGSILMAFALFVIALKMKNKTYNSRAIRLFNTNTTVYIIHVIVGEILNMTPLKHTELFIYLRPVFVFFVSVIIALSVNYMQSPKKKFKQKSKKSIKTV